MESKPFTLGEFVRLLPELITAYVVGWMLIARDFFVRSSRRNPR
jgi:hypothetical protein